MRNFNSISNFLGANALQFIGGGNSQNEARKTEGEQPRNRQRISNLSLTLDSTFVRYAACIALLLCLGVGQMWGDTTLFNVDFTDETTETISTSNSGATYVSKTYDGYTMSFGVKSSKDIDITNGTGVNFKSNNYDAYQQLAIPLTGLTTQKVTVVITLHSAGTVKYAWASGNLPATPTAPSATTYSPSGTTNTLEYTPASSGNYVLYLGRSGSGNGSQYIESIVITQAEPASTYGIAREANSWTASSELLMGSGTVVSKTLSLSANTDYAFKVVNTDGNTWYGNGEVFGGTRTQSVSSTGTANNCHLLTTEAGDYKFEFNTSTKDLTITYPKSYKYYYANTGSWTNVYVYKFTSNGSTGNNAGWPGVEIASPAYTCGGTDYYETTSDGFAKLIFTNNNDKQTSDMVVSSADAGKYTSGDNSGGGTTSWTAWPTYTISFAANGGSGSMSSISSIACGSDKTITANTFRKLGYTFAGWKANVAVTIDGVSKAAGTVIEDEAELENIGSDITLTAQWNAYDACPTSGTVYSIQTTGTISSEVSIKGNTTIDASTYSTITHGYAAFTNKNASDGKAKIATGTPPSFYFNGDDAYITMSMHCPLQTGDTIIFTRVDGSVEMCFTTTTTIDKTTYKTSSNKFVVPVALNGVNTLYAWRQSSSSLKVRNITVKRPVPIVAPSNAEITPTNGWIYVPGEGIELTASADDTDAKTTYTWYKGSDLATAKAAGAIQAAKTAAAGGTTYTIASCTASDAARYWCEISNGTGYETSASYDIKIYTFFLYNNSSVKIDDYTFTTIDRTNNKITVSVPLENINYTYYFKVSDGLGTWYGKDDYTITGSTNYCDGLSSSGANVGLTSSFADDYSIEYYYNSNNVVVRYPVHNQAANKVVYFDNTLTAMHADSIFIRIGHDANNKATGKFTLVPGTANLYVGKTTDFNDFHAWSIANNVGWTGSNTIYQPWQSGGVNKPDDEYAITKQTDYQHYVVEDTISIIPSAEHNEEYDCQYYTVGKVSKMKTQTVTISSYSNGTITVNYTDTGNVARSFTSGSKTLAHTCILTSITAVPNTGYEIDDDITINESDYAANYVVTGATTIAASFKPQTYSITYKDQGDETFSGTHADGYPTTHTYATATTLKTASKTGYTFDGWYGNSTCTGDPMTSIGATSITADITLYAKWTIKTYTVSFVSNNDDYGTVDVSEITGVTHGSEVDINGNVLTLNETDVTPTATTSTAAYTYAFSGWSVSDGAAITSAQTITATFTRTANSYTLAWDKNGGSTLTGDYTSGTTAYGTTLTAPNDPTRDGYTFAGWNSADDGTGDDYTGTMPAAAVTYYAQWEEIPYCYEFAPTLTSGNLSQYDVAVTSSGGILEYTPGESGSPTLSYSKFGDNNGLLFGGSSSSIVTIALKNNIQEGTIITAEIIASNNKSDRTLYLRTASSDTNLDTWTIDASSGTANDVETFTYTVPAEGALIGTNKFRIVRKNNAAIKSLKVSYCGSAATTYNVSHSLTNVSFSSGIDAGTGAALAGGNYTAIFEADDCYTLPSTITVTIGGDTKTVNDDYKWDSSTGKLVIWGAKVTGAIGVTIAGVDNHTDPELAYETTAVSKKDDDDAFTNALTNTYGVTVSYESSDKDVATVDSDGEVTIVGAGTCTITAFADAQDCYTADDASYTLTVTSCTSPTIGSQPADVAICPGSTTTLTVSSITGGNTPYTYQWYDASDDSEVSSGSGYTTASFTTPTLDAAASYYCIVTENGGCTTQSETADVTMKTTTAITSGPSSVANAVVGSASSLSVTAEGTNLSYQWYTCDDDEKTNADDLDDETDATLSVTPASVGVTYYYCVVSGDCGTETSDVVSITAKNSISPTLTYASTVTYGSTISPTLSGAGDGSVTYSLNSVNPANSLSINSSTGVVSGDAAGGTATVTATITAGDDYWGGSATSSTITVTKADLSVSATAGEADDVTHNSATLPFELSSTDGVGSVTLTIYLASDDSEVTSVTGVTAATSGSGEVTGLEASTTYYFTVTPIGDANHNDGTASDASEEFTTDDAPTLSALVAGTLYKVEDMVPASCTSITGSEAYWEGLSDNAKFFLVGSASSSTTMAVKNDSHEVDGISFSNSYYFKSAATLSSNTPTDKAIKFIVPTGGGTLKVWVRNAAAIKLAKEGVAGTALHASDGSSDYHAYTKDVTAGTWYLYATGGTTTLYGVQFLVNHSVSAVTSTGDNSKGKVSAASTTVAEGLTTVITAVPATGYEVSNWAVSGTGASIDPDGDSDSNTTTLTMGSDDATVTVTFAEKEYSVEYDGNGKTGGSVPTDEKVYHYGDEVEVSDNTGEMTKTGYTFVGWTYNGTFYQVGDKFVITEDATLAAAWKLDGEASCAAYVWYNAVPTGKTNTDRFSFTSAPSGSNNESQTMTIGDTDYTCEKRSSSWNSTFTFSVAAEKIGVLYFRINAAGSTTRTITITNTTTSATTTISGIDNSAYKTYTSAPLPAGSYSVSISATIYVSMIGLYECDAQCYDVSFENMDGFEGSAVTTLPDAIENVPTGNKILQPVDPTTTGEYVFGGWYKEAACSNAWDFASDQVTSATTLYAKWYDADYTIRWEVNGKTYKTTKMSEDLGIILPAAPADNTLGCANSFRGWSETNLYGASGQSMPADLFITAADAPEITADKTFYAVFGTATSAASVGTVLWSENWTGATTSGSASDAAAPSGQVDHSGLVVYSGDVTYTETSNATYVRNNNNAGGATPELMISSKETWTVSGIPVGKAKTINVSYLKNAQTLDVGYWFGEDSIGHDNVTSATSRSFDIDCSGQEATTFTLKFTATTGSNVRIDNIVVKVKEDGATDYRCICPSLTVTPKLVTDGAPIFITSAASKTVRSQDSLLIVGSGLDKSATLTLKSPSSKFTLKTRTNEAISTDETGAIDAVAYIFYTPDAGDTSDGLDKYSTFTITDGSNDAEVDQDLIGRHLPADFVIAVKRNNKWYALPANMDELTNPSPVEISVDDINNPSVAYSATSNIYNLYGQSSGAGYLEEAGQYIKLGMKNNSNKPLFGSTSSTIKGDGTASVTNNIGKQYWWLLTQTKTGDVTTSTAQYSISCANNSNPFVLKENAGNPQWGFYSTGSVGPIRIIPASSAVFAEAEIVAWGKNSAIVEVDNSTMNAYYVKAKLPEDVESDKITLSQTRTSVKGTGTRYNYTVNFGEGVDFSANDGKMLTLEWYDILDNFKAVTNIMVPCIVASNITINKSNYSNKSDWNKEVHVLPGDTVTIDASGYSGKNITIKELVIYPGARVVVQKDTLITPTLVLRNGWNRLTAETEYNVAQMYITPTTGSLQATAAYADWYIDYDQYYPIAVPWKVATANIAYRNTSGEASEGVIVRYYDGERRAKGGAGNTNWKQYTWGYDMPTNLEPGIGYAITARRPAGKAFSIVRLPLTIPSTAWTTEGEQGEVSDTHKDQVAVTAWVKDEGETPEYAKGWNFVANPYMSSYEGEITFAPTSNPGVEYEEEITYVNIPDVNFKEFEQVAAETAELKPGCGFLIQTEYNGTITFGTSHRKASAPSYRTSTPRMPKQKAYILLNGEEAVDQMGLIIADRYTENYEVNADLEKLLSDGNTLRTYMQYGNLNMAYVAINSMLAQELIPVSVRIPAAGEYTYSLHYASRVSELEGIYLVDYMTNKVTNLMESDYTFTSEAGTITDRFAINAIEGQHETPTDIDVVQGGGDIQADHPIKFIYQEKVYIYHKGVIYDAMGKKVAERRAAL